MNGRGGKSKKNPVAVRGPWLPTPLDFLRSRACAALSPLASKLLMDLMAQLGPNARGNGDLSAAPAVLAPRGWSSNSTRVAALQELEAAGVLCVTRRGDRRRCTLYGITLFPMDCDREKLEVGPGAWGQNDWQGPHGDLKGPPTAESPATWTRPRKRKPSMPLCGKNESSEPATGQRPACMNPQRDKSVHVNSSFEPPARLNPAPSSAQVIPLRDTYLNVPSAAGAGASIGSGWDDSSMRTAA